MINTQSKSTKGQKELKVNIPNEYSGKILSKLLTD